MKKPRVKEKKVRLEEIQAAARGLFFRKGLKATSMEKISNEAGVSKGTVYLYFKSKEDLYISSMMPVLEELGLHLLRLERELNELNFQTCEELLFGLLDVFWQVYQNDPDGLLILQAFQQRGHFLEVSEEISDKISYRARANFNATRRIFNNSIKMGLIKDQNVIQLSDTIWALFMGIVQLEDSKMRTTGKDHLYETLKYSFKIVSAGIYNS